MAIASLVIGIVGIIGLPSYIVASSVAYIPDIVGILAIIVFFSVIVGLILGIIAYRGKARHKIAASGIVLNFFAIFFVIIYITRSIQTLF